MSSFPQGGASFCVNCVIALLCRSYLVDFLLFWQVYSPIFKLEAVLLAWKHGNVSVLRFNDMYVMCSAPSHLYIRESLLNIRRTALSQYNLATRPQEEK